MVKVMKIVKVQGKKNDCGQVLLFTYIHISKEFAETTELRKEDYVEVSLTKSGRIVVKKFR